MPISYAQYTNKSCCTECIERVWGFALSLDAKKGESGVAEIQQESTYLRNAFFEWLAKEVPAGRLTELKQGRTRNDLREIADLAVSINCRKDFFLLYCI